MVPDMELFFVVSSLVTGYKFFVTIKNKTPLVFSPLIKGENRWGRG